MLITVFGVVMTQTASLLDCKIWSLDRFWIGNVFEINGPSSWVARFFCEIVSGLTPLKYELVLLVFCCTTANLNRDQ